MYKDINKILKIDEEFQIKYQNIYKKLHSNTFIDHRLLEIKNYFYKKYYIDYFSFHFFYKNMEENYYFNQSTNDLWHEYNWRAVRKNIDNIFNNNIYFLKSYKKPIENHNFIYIDVDEEFDLFFEIIGEYKYFNTIGLKDLDSNFKILITFSFKTISSIIYLPFNIYITLIEDMFLLENSFNVFFKFFIKYGFIFNLKHNSNNNILKYILNEDKFKL
jgi:hypothetical protein